MCVLPVGLLYGMRDGLWLCCCAGPFPRCSLCCSHWGGLVVVCLGLMLPALHSAPVGPRAGRPPSSTAETHTHTHIQKHTHPHGGFFSFSTRAKHKGRRPSHRFSLLCSALPHPSFVSIFSFFFCSCFLFAQFFHHYHIHTYMNYYMGKHAFKIY